MRNLTYPLGYDLLLPSVRIWSQRLTTFYIEGAIEETVFWPHALETGTSAPEWPNLEKIHAKLEQHTSSGWWYFMPKGKPKYLAHLPAILLKIQTIYRCHSPITQQTAEIISIGKKRRIGVTAGLMTRLRKTNLLAPSLMKTPCSRFSRVGLRRCDLCPLYDRRD
jgi:hypothetical protein